VRVVETLEHVGQGYGSDLAPAWDQRIYLASTATLLDVVHGLPDGADHVLLVGHNPGLEELVLRLVPEGGALRDQAEIKFPTATLAEMNFDIDSWGGVKAGGATLARFVRPRDLDPSLGPDSP
jgi:phosphohistidine phosphatase